ncbi:hypothetical protein D3C85_942880 [compost metagenome]
MTRLTRTLIAASLLAAHAGVLHAAVTAEEAKQLGTTLTPIGAEMAGNADGSIPAYTGGLKTAPAGFDKSKGTCRVSASTSIRRTAPWTIRSSCWTTR